MIHMDSLTVLGVQNPESFLWAKVKVSEGLLPSGGSRREFLGLSRLPASHLYSVGCGPFLHLPSQAHSVPALWASIPAHVLWTLVPPLTRATVITPGSPGEAPHLELLSLVGQVSSAM